MAKQNRSQTGAVERVQKPFKPFLVVMSEWLATFTEMYRQPLSAVAVKAYQENLSDLTAEQLDAACRHAVRTSEFMPTIATIRKAYSEISYSDYALNRPAYLDEEPLSAAEREEAIRESKNFMDKLRQQFDTSGARRSIEEQKRILRQKGLL